MSLKAIIFDLDNTLLPSSEGYSFALDQVFGEDLRDYSRARASVKARLPAGSPAAHNRVLYFKEALASTGDFSARRVLQMVEKYEGHLLNFFAQHWKTSSCSQVLGRLSQQYKLAILTNENLRTQLLKLQVVDPEGALFKIVVTSEEVGVEKPDSRMFQAALEQLKESASDVAFVGDSVEDDLRPSLALGFGKVFHFKKFLPSPVETPHGAVEISSFEQLQENLS